MWWQRQPLREKRRAEQEHGDGSGGVVRDAAFPSRLGVKVIAAEAGTARHPQ